jgi:hypothetical protein
MHRTVAFVAFVAKFLLANLFYEMKFSRRMLHGTVLINGYSGTFLSFFRDCLTNLMEEEDSFSGKRPLGSSGWKSELIASMIHNGYIEGSFDDDSSAPNFTYGFPKDFSALEATDLLRKMLKSI